MPTFSTCSSSLEVQSTSREGRGGLDAGAMGLHGDLARREFLTEEAFELG